MRHATLATRLVLAAVLVVALPSCSKKPAPAPASDVATAPVPPPPAPVQPVRPDRDVAPVEDVGSVKDAGAVRGAGAAKAGDVAFTDVFFDFSDYAIRQDQRSAMDANAQSLRANSRLKITVEGHCDERDTQAYNMALGQKRADAVKDYLVALGVEANRVQTISYGKERPFATGHDEASWQQNRRVHFVVESR